MLNQSLYPMIFKRKSFHLFRNVGDESISSTEISEIYSAYKTFTPLVSDIRTEIRIVPGDQTTCSRGQEYCILIYSEKKDNYLSNVGYLGQQLDLYLVSRNIGTLWFGIGKTEEVTFDGLDYVIMIAIRKITDQTKYRKDMFRSKRKVVSEIWDGPKIDRVTDVVRFAPSACNTQPWYVESTGTSLLVYRYKKPGKRGIMPVKAVSYYNRIDVGIFLCFIDLTLENVSISYKKEIFVDSGADCEKTLVARYNL